MKPESILDLLGGYGPQSVLAGESTVGRAGTLTELAEVLRHVEPTQTVQLGFMLGTAGSVLGELEAYSQWAYSAERVRQ